jgi:uncharacterized protein involved in high-affinity Fe2+ transport
MPNRWAGPLIAVLVVAGVAGFLFLNMEPNRSVAPPSGVTDSTAPAAEAPAAASPRGAPFREYPIGEPAERNFLEVAAVWLPSVHLAGDPTTSDPNIIHVEADIHATEGNPNGFAKDEFVPYLTIRYRIEPKSGGPPIEGTMLPMVARDGLHYGAGIVMPGPGEYRLIYRIEPPATNGLGRHDDPVTGVADWWEPFEVTFDWSFAPPAGA